jgi:group I intron endonuclease
MYVYKIVNKINGKIYIGQCSKSIDDSIDYYGSGILIQRAISKYGISNFEKEILCECTTFEELDSFEIYYIHYYNSIETGYNISIGGNGGNLGDIVNKKISNTIKNMWTDGHYSKVKWNERPVHVISDETKEKIRKSQSGELGYWYGKRLSEEHISRIRDGVLIAYNNGAYDNLLNAMRSDKVRETISNSLKGNIPWNKGKSGVYTDEQLQRMSDAAKNRTINEDTEIKRREKISKYFSENHPNKISISDTRTNIIYNSLKEFCDMTGISWYRTKKMRKDGIIKEVIYEN